MRSVRLGLFLLLTLSACGDERVPAAPSPTRRDSGTVDYTGDGGSGGRGGSDADAGARDGGVKPAGPQVTITSPTAASDPNDDELVTEPTVKVSCKVERALEVGAAAVDKSAVKISLQDPADPEKWTDAPVNAAPSDIYEASFELSALPNGKLHFRCTGKDLAMVPNSTTTTLDTFLDLGPTIEVISPDKMTYTLKTPVAIQFKVTGNPVSDADKESDVDTITLLVSGVETKFEESMTTPGLYQTSVDFDDRLQFPVPPESAQIAISATNKRSPNPPTRSKKVDLTIDGDGPVIVVKSPADGQIVHGERVLEVEVTDPAGVDRKSLTANIGNGLLVIRDWEGTAPTFRQRFDTRSFGTKLTRLTINITALDGVGNETTVALTLKLDNLPPVISLDPPFIREWHEVNDSLFCSALFDPVGSDAPDDGESLTSTYGYFRVLVEDKTNQPVSGANEPPPGTYIAGVNVDKVELYMQRDPSIALLIDTDGNGVCDEINFEALPAAQRPAKLKLSPVTPGGSAYYKTYDPDETHAQGPSSNPLVDNVMCSAPPPMSGEVMQPKFPDNICLDSYMFRVVPARATGRPPAVFALRPTNGSSGECTGEYWELSSLADRGWICLAARVEDNIGNIGVSAPMRICYGDGTTPDCSGQPMPDCTVSKCTISDAQQFQVTDGSVQWYFP